MSGPDESPGERREAMRRWLESFSLGRYARVFAENDIDLEILPRLSESDLESLGVSLGHRRKLAAALEHLSSADEPTSAGVAAPPPERRQVTVMFCDLVGSTELAERIDAEELHEVLRAYQQAATQAIVRYGGFVARYMGDGILAYFGYPTAYEDNAERAVHAGCALLAALEGLEVPGSRVPELILRARVGVATGEVVVGEVIGEGSAQERAVVGETPNLAARLQALAPPGAVVVADRTRVLTEDSFEYVDFGRHALKGISVPARVWRVRSARSRAERFTRASRRDVSPLVGREEEITLVLRRWRQALEGDAQTVILSGEPGVGKSRLLKAVRERLGHELRNRVLYYGSPYHQQSALFPVIEQVARALRFEATDEAEQRLEKLEATFADLGLDPGEHAPVFAQLLGLPFGARHAVTALGPEALRERTRQSVVAVLGAMAAREPVLWVVEDAHWVDPSTRELVRIACHELRAARMLCVIMLRPEAEPDWRWGADATRLTIGHLTSTEVAALVAGVAGGKALPATLVERIVESSGGVALFAEELTRSVLESDLLRERDGRFELVEARGAVDVPATLHDSLMARLDRLGATRDLVQMASVFGRAFKVEWLEALAAEGAVDVREGLARLVEAGLLVQMGAGAQERYAFRHALIQETAYRALLARRRREYHRRVAEVFVERFSTLREEAPEVIARHFDEASRPVEAARYWLRAALLALDRAANPEAAGHAARGLEGLKRASGDAQRSDLELRLCLTAGLAHRRHAQHFEAMTSFARAIDLAIERADVARLSEAAVGHEQAEFYSGRQESVSVVACTKALEFVPATEAVARSSVLSALARALSSTGERERARALRDEAEALARSVDDAPALIDALNMTCYMWRDPSQRGQRLRATEETIRIASAIDDLDRLQRAYSWRVFDAFESGDMKLAKSNLEHYEALVGRSRQPAHAWVARSARCVEAITEGRFADAERLAREASVLGARVQGLDDAGQYGVQMFTIRREQGRLAALAPVIERVLSQRGDSGLWQPGLALLYADLDRRLQAAEVFESLAATDFPVAGDATATVSLAYLAEVCAVIGDQRRARVLHALLAPYSGYTVTMGVAVVCLGAADRFLGLLAATFGDFDAAEHHYRRALALESAMSAAPWLAHSRECYARLLLERGGTGDREHARALLAQARDAASALGMAALQGRIASMDVAPTAID